MTLFGWDVTTWKRALQWAGETSLSGIDMLDQKQWPRFAAVRAKWLRQGGPFDGPASEFQLSK